MNKGIDMELAWQIADNNIPHDFPDGLIRTLCSIYEGINPSDLHLEEILSCLNRIYAGDEFCRSRLPDQQELSRLIRFSEKKDLLLTLLTPVLTDSGIEQSRNLFDRLYQWNPKSEVVVNDLGVLFFLKKNYPGFQLSMGRLFNRGFKDPRLTDIGIQASRGRQNFLSDCSFNHENIQELAQNLGIQRFEQDLLPYADIAGEGTLRPGTAVYLPFGYVTTGRVCFTAGLNKNSDTRFSLSGPCSSPCAMNSLELKSPELAFKLFQKGNTVFYLYTLAMIRSLFEKARQLKLRLVYQGDLL